MQKMLLALALTCCFPLQAIAAAPELGARESDAACAGLFDMAFQAAKQSAAPPEAVAATAAAYGIFVGRLSRDGRPGGGRDAQALLGRLSVDEMNAYMQVCKAKASEVLADHSR